MFTVISTGAIGAESTEALYSTGAIGAEPTEALYSTGVVGAESNEVLVSEPVENTDAGVNANRSENLSDMAISNFELKLNDAVHAFYHADWGYSDSLLTELTVMEPDDARAHFFRSMIPFWSYFFGGNDPEHARRFLDLSEKAISVSEKRLKKAPADTSMVLLLSGLYGYRSLVAADQKEFRTAIRSGMTGFTYTRQLLSLNTDDPNALLGRGVFDYMSGSVPGELRWMTRMFGMRGSKSDGFKLLEEAAESNSYVSTDARMFLCYLYSREERYEDVLRVSEMLIRDFPDNAIFRYYYAHSLEKTGKIDEAITSYENVAVMEKPDLESLREKAGKRVEALKMQNL